MKRVIDGDKVDVKLSGKTERVRIVGIATPERGRCAYEEATKALKRQLRQGGKVKLVRDRSQPNKDRCGRLLRYVEDGWVDVGRRQLTTGWARVLVVGSAFDRVEKYRQSANKAKKRGRGVRGRCGGFRR